MVRPPLPTLLFPDFHESCLALPSIVDLPVSNGARSRPEPYRPPLALGGKGIETTDQLCHDGILAGRR
jgi:hypothetical protein